MSRRPRCVTIAASSLPIHRSAFIQSSLQFLRDRRSSIKSVDNLEVRHPRCVGSITKNFVHYTYSRTQLYFIQ
jgi:hypothetical protein